MDVATAHFDVVERAAAGTDGVGQDPDSGERDIKRRGGDQLALPVPLVEDMAVNFPYAAPPGGVDGEREAAREEQQGAEDGQGDSTRMQQQEGHAHRRARQGPL